MHKALSKSNGTYDALKWAAQIGLPTLGALYFTLAQIWHLPSAEEVVGSITAIDAALGVLLGISTAAYNKNEARFDGNLNVIDTGDGKTFSLELNGDPEKLAEKTQIVFKVAQTT